MSTISLRELERNMEAVLARVEAGECVIVAREGKPVAELRPLPAEIAKPRPFGLATGMFTVPDDFDASLPNAILDEFEKR